MSLTNIWMPNVSTIDYPTFYSASPNLHHPGKLHNTTFHNLHSSCEQINIRHLFLPEFLLCLFLHHPSMPNSLKTIIDQYIVTHTFHIFIFS